MSVHRAFLLFGRNVNGDMDEWVHPSIYKGICCFISAILFGSHVLQENYTGHSLIFLVMVSCPVYKKLSGI
jgi:hypothetical protein